MKALAVLILLAGPAAALTLPEGAEESARSAEPSGRWTLPAGPWQAATCPSSRSRVRATGPPGGSRATPTRPG
ncbi:MAG: hypothetical protein JKP98_22220 [Rhodobacteraceae bacterium]|nr:hypothetical protein [Paracoccaceae bacterium]